MVAVVLGVCTFRRPTGLTRLLDAVAGVVFDGALRVVVVDNDPAHAGIAVCRRLRPHYRWPLACVAEPTPGISHARNRVVAESLKLAPAFIAMLDDDEWPGPGWLAELMAVQRLTDADVVGGPIVPSLEQIREPWLSLADLYGVEQAVADGAPCTLYASGNFLARSACFRALMPEPFDPRFAQSGGEDLAFFHRLARTGHRMAWARNAVAFETIPRSRLSLKWLCRRQLRIGAVNVAVQRTFEPGLRHEAKRLARTAALLAVGLARLLVALPSRPRRMRALALCARALGKVLGHAGRSVAEYRRPTERNEGIELYNSGLSEERL